MKKTNLKQEQELLNIEKWEFGIELGYDPSGYCKWCKNCIYKNDNGCVATQEEKDAKNLCAKNSRKLKLTI